MFDDGNKNSSINLQQQICIVNIMNINYMLTLKQTKMSYFSISDIVTLDKPFITFKFTNNTIAKRRVVWEPWYRGLCAFSSKRISRPSSSSLLDALVLSP